MFTLLPLWGLLCRGIKKSMLVRPVLVCLMSVSPAPNGRPAPNIHTWDSHMPYGYFPEMFEIFSKLPKMNTLFGTKRFGRASHTLKKRDQNHAD